MNAVNPHTDSRYRRHSPKSSSPEQQGIRRLVDPFRCRLWAQHSRPDEQLTDEACKSLRQSVAKNGQHQAALGRPLLNDPECEIEIICGARRHAVARTLRRDLLVDVRQMTDAEAYVAMYEENLLREGDSPYARGQILLRAFRSGTYKSQVELGGAFNLSHAAVSRLLMLGQLPSVVLAAFPSCEEIREAWGVQLFRLWTAEETRAPLAARARALSNDKRRRSSRNVYEMLIAPSGGIQKYQRLYRNVPVRGASNDILFYEQDQLERVMYVIPKTLLTPSRREALKLSLARFLEADCITKAG